MKQVCLWAACATAAVACAEARQEPSTPQPEQVAVPAHTLRGEARQPPANESPHNFVPRSDERDKAKQLSADEPLRNFVPKLDERAEAMVRGDTGKVDAASFAKDQYFLWPVPHIVHRVLQDSEQDHLWSGAQKWQAHADAFAYELHTWRPSDVANGNLPAAAALRTAVVQACGAGREDVAMHLTGLAALQEQGGVWVGPHTSPPALRGKPVAIDRVVNMKGLTVASNLRARNVGGISAYVTTAFMAAPPLHPWVRTVAEAAGANTSLLLSSESKTWPVRYFAGNAFLSRHLAGVFHVIPFRTLQALDVFVQGGGEGAEDALD